MTKAKNYSVWTLQIILAVLFLFTGGMKLILPAAVFQAEIPFSEFFIKFIGLAEVLGGLCLVFPAVFKVKPILTSLAALGLFVVMVGATIVTASAMGIVSAVFPIVVGLICLLIAFVRFPNGSKTTANVV